MRTLIKLFVLIMLVGFVATSNNPTIIGIRVWVYNTYDTVSNKISENIDDLNDSVINNNQINNEIQNNDFIDDNVVVNNEIIEPVEQPKNVAKQKLYKGAAPAEHVYRGTIKID